MEVISEFIEKLILPRLLGEPPSQNVNIAELQKKLFVKLKPYVINSGLSENDYHIFMKFNVLTTVLSYEMLKEMVFAYSHEQISRYPTDIEGISSTVLYEKNKESLHDLIQNIKKKM